MIHTDSKDKNLYMLLNTEKYTCYPYETKELQEGMALVSQVIGSWWKPRFLLNHDTKCAYEFMDINEHLTTVTQNDIIWDSLQDISEIAVEQAKRLSAHFPTFIHEFKNGVAPVSWQINPDGHYCMDDDGFGMTDDEEITIYGYLDCKGRVVSKFRAINNYNELDTMRKNAENSIKRR